MRHGRARWSSTLGLIALVSTCGPPPGGPRPAPPDHSAAQREAWKLVPAHASFGLTIANPRAFVERLAALRTVLRAGPTVRKHLDDAQADVQRKLGFDPLDPDAWAAQGIDLAGPVILAATDAKDESGSGTLALVRVTDAAKATALLVKLAPEAAERCREQKPWLVCSEGKLAPATSEGQSLLGRVTSESGEGVLGSNLVAFVPIDDKAKGLVAGEPDSDPAKHFFAGSRSVSIGLSITADALIARGFWSNPEAKSIEPYVRRPAGTPSLLGLAVGAQAVTRLFVDVAAIWKSVKDKMPAAERDQMLGAAQMMGGLDLEADLINNLTGEMLGLSHQPGAGALLLGTRDDARTRKLAERLDGLAAGGLQVGRAMLDASGTKIERKTIERDGRPAYVYTVALPGEAAKLGASSLEIAFGTTPSAFVLAFGAGELDALAAAQGANEDAFLRSLPSDAARDALTKATFGSWGVVQDPFAGATPEARQSAAASLAAVTPEAPQLVNELSGLLDLMDDGVMRIDVRGEGISFAYEVNFL